MWCSVPAGIQAGATVGLLMLPLHALLGGGGTVEGRLPALMGEVTTKLSPAPWAPQPTPAAIIRGTRTKRWKKKKGVERDT